MYDNNDDMDKMILVEADFEIIKKLTNKINILDENLEKLIDNNNVFISKMIIMEKSKTKDLENVENNIYSNNIDDIKNTLYNMKIQELKDICKNNYLKKYTNMKKNVLIEYIINNIDLNILQNINK